MRDRASQVQALYEIALSIGPKATLEQTADDALVGYLKKLNCSFGAVCHQPDDESAYEHVSSIPSDPDANEALQDALTALESAEAFPLEETTDSAHYYCFELPAFGALVLGKRGGRLTDEIVSSLTPLNEKLAEACRSKLIESRLRAERNRFEAMFEAISEPAVHVAIRDGLERIVQVNAAFEDTFGYANDRAVGEDLNELIGQDDAQAETARLRDQIAARRTITTEVSRETAAGVGEFLFRGVPVDSEGPPEYFGVYVDITEQKAHERKLERYERLVEHLPIGVYRTTAGPDGEFTLVNQGLVDILEADSKEYFADRHVSEIYLDPTDRATFSDHLRDVGRVDGYELELKTAAGTPIWGEVSGIAVEEDGATVFELALQNVTQRKEREQQLTVYNRILRHNIRNGMNVIRGRANLLAEAVADPELADHLGAIDAEAAKVGELSEKARTVLSLFDQGRTRGDRCAIDQLLFSLAGEFQGDHPDAQVTVGSVEAMSAAADERLELALRELLTNAIKHNDAESPTVTLEARPSAIESPAEYVDVVVTDDGPGIPVRERKAIETGEETPLQHSTGLGLWIVYWATSLLGGQITIEQPTDGSRVILTLPRAETGEDVTDSTGG